MLGNTGSQPQPVTVSRRIPPLPAAAKLHLSVSDHADSQLMAYVIGIVHPTFLTCLSHCSYFLGLPGGAINSPHHPRRLLCLTASLYRSHALDHFSLVADMFGELGIGDVIGRAAQQHPELRDLTVGEAVKAMVLNDLGGINQALYLGPGFSTISPPTAWFHPALRPSSSTMMPSAEFESISNY